MSLFASIIGFIIVKFFFQSLFYAKQWKRLLLLVLATSLATAPLLAMLYRETAVDFFYVYIGMIVLDILLLNFLVEYKWWKAIVSSFLANTFLMIFFFIGNG
ncbi:MAG: hypothetical protein JST23_12110 [Bacteroidetes bacterium]|nr:hypothetical protein [Bacteroidota bacterium]